MILNETAIHPEKSELLIRVCVAVNEVNGEIPMPDQVEIVRMCGELGMALVDCGLYTDQGHYC